MREKEKILKVLIYKEKPTDDPKSKIASKANRIMFKALKSGKRGRSMKNYRSFHGKESNG